MSSYLAVAQPGQNHNILTPTTVKFFRKPMPFEQKITFGIKSYVGVTTFGLSEGSAYDLKPHFGVGAIANFKILYHISLRHELLLGYNRYKLHNVNYSISYPWLLNYHFKHHAFVNFGLQPSLVFLENSYSEPSMSNGDVVSSAFELSGVLSVEYPIDENLDLGVRLSKSFNALLKTDIPDYQGITVSFTYYWDRFSSNERKLMNIKVRKKPKPTSRAY
ncbi:MAG TPA: hypothetical protein VL947_06735 [Cytophagales bacterium]|nr:hypothetical protein [Cytophagales bacterium]